MNYGEQVLSRLMNPGTLLLIVGAVAVYASRWIVRFIAPGSGDKANLVCKGFGCLIAVLGALLILGI